MACAALGVLFCLLGGGFFLTGPKAALFVSGFGTLPPSERARYDTAALSPGLCPAVSGLGRTAPGRGRSLRSLERMGCAAGTGSLAGAVLAAGALGPRADI